MSVKCPGLSPSLFAAYNSYTIIVVLHILKIIKLHFSKALGLNADNSPVQH